MITAIDVGATKTLLSQFDDEGKQIHKQRFLTPDNADNFLQELHAHLARFTDITTIAIAVPGVVAPDGTLLKCGTLPWKNVPLKKLLTTAYNCPVVVENDAKLAAFFEVNHLPAVPRLGMYITLSTGIGVGIVLDGELSPQLDYSEPGHMSLYFQDGLRVWQDFASGKAIAARFGKQASELRTPQEWQEVAERVSLGLHALIPALQPDVIMFGGGLGKYFNNFKDALDREVRAHLSPYIAMPRLQVAAYPEDAVLYGCYRYALHQQPAATPANR